MNKTLKKILWGIAAAFTTPEAIKAEKSLAAIAVTRFVVLVPAAAVVGGVILRLLGA